MKIRLIAALVLAAGTVALAADEPNPYAKAKVGDYAVYNTTTKLAGIEVKGTLTQTVTAINDKDATIAVTGKVNNQELPAPVEFKIDLTKPFDPTKANGALPPGVEMQVEKVKEKERTEKVKVGTKTYDARVENYNMKVKAGGQDFQSRMKAWIVKDLPVPMAKMELVAEVEMQRLDVQMELVETGNRPLPKKEGEKKEPDRKEPAKTGTKDAKK